MEEPWTCTAFLMYVLPSLKPGIYLLPSIINYGLVYIRKLGQQNNVAQQCEKSIPSSDAVKPT